MKGLSIIIPSYNTKKITLQCIESLVNNLKKTTIHYEIIIIDNHSVDCTVDALTKKMYPYTKLISNRVNKGYGVANNQGLKQAQYDYVLFLNSDVIVNNNINFLTLINYLEDHKNVGALTVTVELPNGELDPASHRGFPTLWRSFCYFFKLEQIFGNIFLLNRLFGGYHLTYLDKSSIHEIDSPTGAFFLALKSLLQKVNGFDEEFFMYGEDLDLSFRIKKEGYKIVYYPFFSVLHLKYQSGLKNQEREQIRRKTQSYFYDTMSIFYRKHYANTYPFFINWLVYKMIALKKRLI